MLPRIFRTDNEIRKRQINTLKVFNENVIEVQEGSEYQVLFAAGEKDLVLHINLSQDFPADKPNLKISPVVAHPWVNAEGEIKTAPGLLNFTVHSDLGRVVRAIIREFERTPPPLLGETPNVSPSVPIRIDKDGLGRASPNYFRQNLSPIMQTITSYQPVMFPELSTMSLEELQFLHDCSERQEEFLNNLPQNRETNKILDDLIVQIEELADSNFNKKSHLDDLQKEVDDRIEEVTKLVFETERLNVQFQNLSDSYSPKNIKNILMVAAKEANDESDKIVKSFLDGKTDVDRFLLKYLEKRTLGQMRKTKEEKLSQQLQNLERAGF